MNKDKLAEFLINHYGKIIGTLVGFLIGIFLLTIGFFKTLILSLCIITGYSLGKKIDNKENIEEFIDKILNTYRKNKEDL